MSRCRFDFEFRCERVSLVRTIQAHVVGAGGAFTGSPFEGSFSVPTPIGVFRGIYRIEGQLIAIEVLEKPFLVPCSAIESTLQRYVKEAT